MLIVHCERCGARYETDLTTAAIERVPRCRTCGRRTLVIVEDEDAPHEEADTRRARSPQVGGTPGDRP